jgi:hypothetical protein
MPPAEMRVVKFPQADTYPDVHTFNRELSLCAMSFVVGSALGKPRNFRAAVINSSNSPIFRGEAWVRMPTLSV